MQTCRRESGATVGATENGNVAVLVTLGSVHVALDRREVALTSGLSTHPYHHEGAWAIGRYLDSPWARRVSLPDALTLIERVHEAALVGARQHLETLAAEIGEPVAAIALRECPALPPTLEERLWDHRAQTVADSVLYRQALAAAATELGWKVHWFTRDQVQHQAARALGSRALDDVIREMGRTIGPPWQARHKLAATAAIAAAAHDRAPRSRWARRGSRQTKEQR